MLKNKLLSAMGGAPANYIEDVFSTYLYTGNGSTQTITNGIDLAGKGGMTWIKQRSATRDNLLFDTNRGATQRLFSNLTLAQSVDTQSLTSFNSNGFSIGSDSGANINAGTYASWTFRKQPKFFDVVTYTGAGSVDYAHSLGSVPGFALYKATNGTSNWNCVCRKSDGTYELLQLNTTASTFTTYANAAAAGLTSTTFNPSPAGSATPSTQFVAYLFAHNAGGFGLTGTDNVISCGSFTADGSGNATVNLGYEPQLVMYKRADGAGSWAMFDNMRGMTVNTTNGDAILFANLSDAESTVDWIQPTATGFNPYNIAWNATYIYIAIRRGPMKVPESGTSVFTPVTATPSGATTVTTNFPVDLAINAQRDAGTSGNKVFWDRLRGSSTAAGQGLFSNLTNAEVSYSGNGIGLQSNTTIVDNFWNTLNGATTPVIYWNFRRAPGFFDEVITPSTYTTGIVNHNLTVVPELMIEKTRSTSTTNWRVYHKDIAAAGALNLSDAFNKSLFPRNPTSTTFEYGNNDAVAYLFASCPGVSKVGSVTHVEPTTVVCGFAPRFVMLKSTASTGTDDWYVFDSARGITSGNDPYLRLNSTGAENTPFGAADFIDPTADGFIMNGFNGGNYIYLAIA